MWFNRHPLNNSLVVFVHGIFGDSWSTWLGVPGIIQSMAEHDPWVRSYDFYSFQYDSTAFHQPPLIPFAVDGLRQFLVRTGGAASDVRSTREARDPHCCRNPAMCPSRGLDIQRG
jgi:hypothetical protein